MEKKYIISISVILICIIGVIVYLVIDNSKNREKTGDYVPFHVYVQVDEIKDGVIYGEVLEDNEHYNAKDEIKIKYSKEDDEMFKEINITKMREGMRINVIYHQPKDEEGFIECDGASLMIE